MIHYLKKKNLLQLQQTCIENGKLSQIFLMALIKLFEDTLLEVTCVQIITNN
jgi:hypothetical protein